METVTYAVIKTGGKQYKVAPGEKIRVDILQTPFLMVKQKQMVIVMVIVKQNHYLFFSENSTSTVNKPKRRSS